MPSHRIIDSLYHILFCTDGLLEVVTDLASMRPVGSAKRLPYRLERPTPATTRWTCSNFSSRWSVTKPSRSRPRVIACCGANPSHEPVSMRSSRPAARSFRPSSLRYQIRPPGKTYQPGLPSRRRRRLHNNVITSQSLRLVATERISKNVDDDQ